MKRKKKRETKAGNRASYSWMFLPMPFQPGTTKTPIPDPPSPKNSPQTDKGGAKASMFRRGKQVNHFENLRMNENLR